MSIERILVADDDPLMRDFVAEVLIRLGKEVVVVKDGEEAIERLSEAFDLVITDHKMPRKNGLDLLRAVRSLQPTCPVILMTAFGGVESAIEAMRLGAFHYLIKPFPPEALEGALCRYEAEARLVKENRYLREAHSKTEVIAQSPVMQALLQDLEKIAKSQASVFLTGESGTGKEVIAGAIHAMSHRATQPFIKVNCAAVPETLVESEFFGYEKGAFTGAIGRKAGRFELADKGTLLLDEVTEIPLFLQPKLLRAIQEQEFERVGATRSVRVDLRFIATSNRNMKEAIEQRIFREDLYYRLNVVPLHLPPLRQRKEDIIPLANYFLTRCCRENHKTPKTLTPKATEKLLDYPWPGNIRELANVIERAVVLDCSDCIHEDEIILSSSCPVPKQDISLKGLSLKDAEKLLILASLETHQYNKVQAANALGISTRTLRNKLKEYQAVE